MQPKTRHWFDFILLRAAGRRGRRKTTSAVLVAAGAATDEKNHVEIQKEPLAAKLPEIKTAAYFTVFLATTTGFLYFTRPALVPVVTACVAGMALKPVVRWLHELHVPLILASAIVVGLVIAGVGIGFSKLSAPAVATASHLPDDIKVLQERAKAIFQPASRLHEAANAVKKIGKPEEPVEKTVTVKDNQTATALLNWTGGLVGGIVETLAVLFLLLASGDMFLHKLVRVTPSLADKKRVIEICQEVQHQISRYLLSVTAINLVLGVLAAAGFFFLKLPQPAMWGAAVTLFNFVPYFGPIVGMCVLAIGGLLSFDDLSQGILPVGWYLARHLVEANFVTPNILGKTFTLNPVVIIISLIFWAWIWGVAGALLSVPILMSLKVLCDRIPALYPVSEFLGS